VLLQHTRQNRAFTPPLGRGTHILPAHLALARFFTSTVGLGRALAFSGRVTHQLPAHPSTTRLDPRATTSLETRQSPASPDWRRSLPTLSGRLVTLRQIEIGDATALLDIMNASDVARFIAAPPPGIEGFERFIERMRHEQQRGAYACFAVVPAGDSQAVGLFQVRALEPGFGTAEWGFALASPYWGTGLFMEAATLVGNFIFDELGASRLEARAAVNNGRGNGALRKLGAIHEAILRRAFVCRGDYLDLSLWSILASDWRRARSRRPPLVGVH
jgi:RimJ/RimL family protein N-acetyltransferase